MSTKDKIISKFSKLDPGLRELLMIIFPTFDTFYMDENDVIHLVDKNQTRDISIVMENKESACLRLQLSDSHLSNAQSLSFRVQLLANQTAIPSFYDYQLGRNNVRAEFADVD